MIIKNLDRFFKSGKGDNATQTEVVGREIDGVTPIVETTDLTLRAVLFGLILLKNEKVPEDEKQRFESFEFSRAINPDDSNHVQEIEFDSKYITLLEKKANLVLPVWQYGQLYEILEGKVTAEAPKLKVFDNPAE